MIHLFLLNAWASEFDSLSSSPASKKEFSSSDLPATGEFALGFSAIPVLNFALNSINIMNDTGDKADGMATYPAGSEQLLTGKYFLSSDQAIRIRVGLNYLSSSNSTNYDNPLDIADLDVTTPSEISDTVTESLSSIMIGGGMEFRRGKGRLVGFYGAEGLLGLMGSSSKIAYGWTYTQEAADLGVIQDGSNRVRESNSGTQLTIGGRGFAGVEYFIASKISLSAEFGWSISFQSNGASVTKVESWEIGDDGSGTRKDETDKTAGSSSFQLGHDDGVNQAFSGGTGAISLNFHF
jgi:hypothetical protein